MYTPEQKARVVAHYRRTGNITESARTVGASFASGKRWLQDAGICPEPHPKGQRLSDDDRCGVTWRYLEKLEEAMPFQDALHRAMVEFCA